MMFKITGLSEHLRAEPKPDGAILGTAIISDLLQKIADSPVAGWAEMRLVTPGVAPIQGFMLTAHLVETASNIPTVDIDTDLFFQTVTNAARTFATSRDFLYALAFIESGLRNIKSGSSDAFGPFQFLPTTWNGMVTKHGDQTRISEADILLPAAQATFAAIYAKELTDAIATAIRRTPVNTELYLAHLLGPSAAVAVLSAQTSQPIDIALRVFYKGTPLGEGFVDKILAANASLLKSAAAVRTTEQVLDEVGKRLDAGFQKAAAMDAKLGPSVEEVPGGQANPPWLATANAEFDKHIHETGNNPEILKYFLATSLGAQTSDQVPWCAAFVSWCMANCGNDKVASANLRTAWAPTWLNWGFSVGRPVMGAVALTGPREDGTPGHMGFVIGENNTTISLLAGNQGNAVSKADIPKVDVVGYRWMDWRSSNDPVPS